MQEPPQDWRQRPTRADGVEVLIEHRIPGTTCQQRQRKLYHKCFTCVHRNAAHAPGTASLPPVPRSPVERPSAQELRTAQVPARAAARTEPSKAGARRAG